MITEAVPSVRSVALGLWVRTGSRDETREQAGVSHFLEHLLFKGTERHSAIEISELFDGMGAATNAATSKESTHLHARLLDEHTEEAFGLLAEMLLAPSLPADEVDSEREVVLEEIAMYEDEPQDRVHDVLAEAMYGDHPLGRRVLGDAAVIESIPVAEIADYHRERYTAPEPGGRRGAGTSTTPRSSSWPQPPARLLDRGARRTRPYGAGRRRRGSPSRPRTPSSTTSASGVRASPAADERRFALSVLDAVFGGSTSSRLFREVREKRGLAYAVGSYTEQYTERGVVAMYVGTREENVAEACEIIGRELGEPPRRGRQRRGARASKEHVKGRMVLGLEATGTRMTRLARASPLRRAVALARRDARLGSSG